MIRDIKLKLGGEVRDFSFGITFLGEVLERLDVDYTTMLNKVSKNPFKYSPILMYESLKNTQNRIGKEPEFTEKDVIDWLNQEENLGVDVMLSFINAFMGTQENKTPEIEVEDEDIDNVKKK